MSHCVNGVNAKLISTALLLSTVRKTNHRVGMPSMCISRNNRVGVSLTHFFINNRSLSCAYRIRGVSMTSTIMGNDLLAIDKQGTKIAYLAIHIPNMNRRAITIAIHKNTSSSN